MKLVILGPNLPHVAPGEIVVHRDRCRDLEGGWTLNERRMGNAIAETHDSVRSVVEGFYGPAAGSFYEENFGENIPEDAWTHYADEFYFYPCCRDLPLETET